MLAELSPGASFAGYEIEALVGRGGMGVVYRAYDPALERRVALKLLAPELSADERFRERFLRETKLAASLDHPHVLPVYAAGEEAGNLFLALRFVEGEDLKSRLGRVGPLGPAEALRILGELAGALDAAHVHGLVHRDVKPANVLLDRSGEAYLADFGLTKLVASASGPTRTGELVGTLAYLAPEQIRGGGVDGRADQYSLACLAFECLAGSLPYARESEPQLLWAHLHDAPARLVELRPELPPALDAVLRRALAKEPEDRFPSCCAFVEAAREALAGDSVAAGLPPAAVAEGAFVGRELELRQLLECLEESLAGHGRLVLIAGEPGIGKSRLAEELAARAEQRGARVVVGRAWEAGGAPAYWPWVQALRSLVAGADPDRLREQLGTRPGYVAHLLSDLGATLPDLGPLPSLESEHARFQLFDATTTFLRNVAGSQPLLVVLDDLHAADEPSLLLLRFVARELGGARILVVGAYRDVDPAMQDPLASSVAELTREQAVRRLRLGGLAAADVAEYIERSAGLAPAGELAAAIHSETEGNPLFVAEVVRLLGAEGRLDVRRGAVPELHLPPSIREVIGQRLRRLPEESARALAIASVFGREFAIDALERLSGVEREALLDALDAAMAAEILARVPRAPGRLRFAHLLIRETLYEDLGPLRLARLHEQAGTVLEDLYAADLEAHLAELAHHYAAAGNGAKALRYSRGAAGRAARLLAFEEAARLYRMALDSLELEQPVDEESRCDLLLGLGDVLARAGDMPSARETFVRAAELARTARMPERLARAALGYGGRFVWSSSEDDRLVPLLEEALGAVGDGLRPLRVRLLARLACALRRTGSAARTASLSREAVELARGLDDRDALAWALVARRVVLWGPDNIDELLALSSEIVALVEEIGDWEQGVNAHTLRLELLLTLGDLAGVRADLGAATRLAEELRLPSHRWHVAVHEVELALLEGRFADAEHHVEQALEFGERAHRAQAIECAVTQRFLLRLEQGRLEELRPALERLAAEGPEAKISLCLLARLECEHDEARARSILDSLAPDDFAGVPRDSDWLLAIALLAEVAVSLRDAARSATLYELLAPYAGLSAGAAHHFNVGSASRYLGLLAASLSRLDDAARHFEDALATNERIGARPWLAHTKHDYARMLLERGASGDRERAGRLLEDCLDTCRELGMPALERRAEDLIEAARSPAASPRPASGAVFVGRQRELGELLGGLDDALAGRGGLFLLAGEPGIGKSRLADELTARARERGAQVLVGRCWEAGGAPAYWPWVQALRGYVRGCDAGLLRSQLGAGAGDVAQLLPELNDLFPDLPLPPSLDPEGARFRLFDSTASFLRVAAERQPFVLVLDDLHAADVPSLLLLEFVAGQLVELRMMLVGAYRDVDPTLRDPLSASLAELSRYPATHFLALAGLTLADLETADSSLRVRLLARLAGALRDQHDREPRARLSSEAVEMARRIGEPATLAYALDGRCSAVMWPENSEERIAIGTELAHVAEETGDQERVLAGRYYRLFALFELGDMPAVQADLEACARLTEQLHQPAQLWLVVVTRATLALFEGRFTEAEALIEEALTLGERAQGSDAVMSYRIQRFALHREQGELERMEAVISRSIEEYPRRPMFRCMLAVLYSETGRDERAKAVFEELASDDFAALPSRNEWLFSMGFLAEVANALGDAKRAASMYELLLPYAERNAVTPDYIATGAVARYLGLLAAVLGRFDDAGRHFEAALELNERMGARPWLAHTQHDYARMLLEREAPGDRERAGELFQACLVTCRELGMPVLEQKTAALAESASART